MEGEFEPRLGRMRSVGSRRDRKYLHAVLAVAGRAGCRRPRSARPFLGTRIGRGFVAALMLCDRDPAFRVRRAFVRTHVMWLGGRGLAAARAHLRYIERDSANREGEPGRLYSAAEDKADGRGFLERCDGDRHQFRIVISAEDGDQYEDLRPLIRRFMVRMEEDLGTRLDWVAADHVDTLHPHTHILLRGKEERGEDLVIAPNYIRRGMRERMVGLLSLDLGPPTDLEVERRLRLDVHAERMTAIDRRLLSEADASRVVQVRGRTMLDHALRTGRLRKLGALGLAEDLGRARWRLREDLEGTLRRLCEQGNIMRTMGGALKAAGIERAVADQVIHWPEGGASIAGRLVARGLADEVRDLHYVVIDGIDGRSHYVDIGKGEATEALPYGAIVRIASRSAAVRDTDRRIAEIATANSGRHDTLRAREALVEIELLSPVPLERLAEHDGATWLDRQLASPGEQPRDQGFGREVRSALALRRAWLVEQGLASADGAFAPDMIASLQRRELLRAAEGIARETGLEFGSAHEGGRVEGIVRRRVDLASGRFAMIDNGREFSLVPWRPDLERAIGRQVSGAIGSEGGSSWAIGRGRGVEI